MFSLTLVTALTLGGLQTLTMANPIAQQITPNLNVPDGYQIGYATVSLGPPSLPTSLARSKPRFVKVSSPLSPFTARFGTRQPTKCLHDQRRRLQQPDTPLQ